MFNGKKLIFRNDVDLNWPQIMDVVKASLLPNPQFSSRVISHIPDKISVIQNWLAGKSIYEITKELESPISQNSQ